MDTLIKEEAYINFLQAINKASNIDSLYENTFDIILKVFGANRAQLWEKVPDSNEMSISYEYFIGNEISMLKFRTPLLTGSAKKIIHNNTIWEYPSFAKVFPDQYSINSLIGIEIKLSENNKGVLILTSKEKNFKHNNDEIYFLIRLKEQLELGVNKINMLERNSEDSKRLIVQNNKLREQDRLRTSFINNISHEFRTPLASIIGFSKMLSTKNLTIETAKEIAEQIQQAANRLSSLITDFLEINKITTEGWISHFEPCDIGEIIKISVEEFNILEKNHKISYIVSDNYPIIKTDQKLVRQVLDNLISNAIKYSPNGGNIIVSLHISKDNNELKVSVTDQGIGIDKDEVSKIFNRLYRSKNSEVQNIAGSGLGLSICKEIISILNGRIEVKSEPNKGSVFAFTLPIN